MNTETERKEQAVAGGQTPLIDEPLQVSYSKYSDGLKIVLLGALEMLFAIEPRQARALVEPIINRDESGDAGPEKGDADAAETEDAAGTGRGADHDDAPDDGGLPDGVAPVDKAALPSTLAITVDDITKVIVAKIKQKRSNNEVIGKLLTAYGAGKVSDLKPEIFEAFLTDISQI